MILQKCPAFATYLSQSSSTAILTFWILSSTLICIVKQVNPLRSHQNTKWSEFELVDLTDVLWKRSPPFIQTIWKMVIEKYTCKVKILTALIQRWVMLVHVFWFFGAKVFDSNRSQNYNWMDLYLKYNWINKSMV